MINHGRHQLNRLHFWFIFWRAIALISLFLMLSAAAFNAIAAIVCWAAMMASVRMMGRTSDRTAKLGMVGRCLDGQKD